MEHGKVSDYVGEFKDQVLSVDQKILSLQGNVNKLQKKQDMRFERRLSTPMAESPAGSVMGQYGSVKGEVITTKKVGDKATDVRANSR